MQLLSQNSQAMKVATTFPRPLGSLAVERLQERPNSPDETVKAGWKPALESAFPAARQVLRDGFEKLFVEVSGAGAAMEHAVSSARRLVRGPEQSAHGPVRSPLRGSGHCRLDSQGNQPVKIFENVLGQNLSRGLDAAVQRRLKVLPVVSELAASAPGT